MTELSIHPDVEIEYEAALRWYLKRSRKAATGFTAAFARTLESIRQLPELYPPYDNRHRFAVMRRYPYIIVYRAESEQVRIIALAHSRRAATYWRKRK